MLELLAELGPMGTRDIAQATRLSQTVVYRLLRTLAWHGFVDSRAGGSRYGIVGLKLPALSHNVYKDLRHAAWPILHDLANQLGATAFLGVRHREEVVCMISAESDLARVTVRYRPGLAQPLTVGASDLVLRSMDPPHKGEESGVVLARKLGYAGSEHEVESYTSAVSVPLNLGAEHSNSCITVVFPKPDLEDAEATASLLRPAATEIAQMLVGTQMRF